MVSRHLTATPTASTATQPPDATTLTHLILTTEDHKTLRATLHSPTIKWTPNLVNTILKRLWNHAPKALLFFNLLHHHPSFLHHPSSFDIASDLSARLRRPHHPLLLRHLRPSPLTFSVVAERYASSGKPHKALNLFFLIHRYGIPQNLQTFNILLDVLCKAKKVDFAYEVFRVFRTRFKADVVSYNIVANGFCLVKSVGKALEVLELMVKKGIDPDLISFHVIVKGYFRCGQVDKAWNFFLEMKNRGCLVDVVTYTTLIHGFGVVGLVARARNVFDRMVKDGVVPTVVTYNALIQVLCKKDSVENAILVFEEMVEKVCSRNSMTYNLVIRGLCHVGEMERAMGFMGRMSDDGFQPNVQTYNVLIRYYCDAGDVEKGLNLFKKMGDSGECLPNLDTYNILTSGMFVRKKPDDLLVAGKLLIEMVDRGFMPRRFIFNRILNGLLLTGNQEFAREILRLQNKCGSLARQFRL